MSSKVDRGGKCRIGGAALLSPRVALEQMATRNYSAVVMNRRRGLVSEIPFVHGKTSDVSTDIYLWPNDFVLRHSPCGDIRAL